jgi:hypothetical protein
MIRKITSALILAAAALAGVAVPALALQAPDSPPAHAPFTITDNGGVLYSGRPLSRGEVVYSGGREYQVGVVYGNIVRLNPGLPASDAGKTIVFWS